VDELVVTTMYGMQIMQWEWSALERTITTKSDLIAEITALEASLAARHAPPLPPPVIHDASVVIHAAVMSPPAGSSSSTISTGSSSSSSTVAAASSNNSGVNISPISPISIQSSPPSSSPPFTLELTMDSKDAPPATTTTTTTATAAENASSPPPSSPSSSTLIMNPSAANNENNNNNGGFDEAVLLSPHSARVAVAAATGSSTPHIHAPAAGHATSTRGAHHGKRGGRKKRK
jgi:hypothetical protein